MTEQIDALLTRMIAAHTTPDRQKIKTEIMALFPDEAIDAAFAKAANASVGTGIPRVGWVPSDWKPVEIVAPGEGHPEKPEPLPLETIGSTVEREPLIEVKKYPCGGSASGVNLPDKCPLHGAACVALFDPGHHLPSVRVSPDKS